MKTVEDLGYIPSRTKSPQERRDWYINIVTDYFVHKLPLKEVKKRHNFTSTQTVYNARDKVNKMFEEANASEQAKV